MTKCCGCAILENSLMTISVGLRQILKFRRDNDDTVSDLSEDVGFKIICCDELAKNAAFLYNAIKEVQTARRKNPILEMQEYLETLYFSQPKSPKMPNAAEDRYGKDSDIIITAKDPIDHAVTTEGYSIKSHIGDPSTLFNSASTSGLVYEIEGCDDDMMARINSIESESGMFKYIHDAYGLELKLIGSKSPEFAANLEFIYLRMIEFVNTALLVQIGYYPKAASQKTPDIITEVAKINPLGITHPDRWYAAKFKEFLFDAFSGMTAVQLWDGHRRMSGGYIDVSEDGKFHYFRAMSDYVFSEYLYGNTFIDRPSSGVLKDVAQAEARAYLEGRKITEEELNAVVYKDGKKKENECDWGYVWKESDKYFVAINFQIKFK